jgi:hypothetical protein
MTTISKVGFLAGASAFSLGIAHAADWSTRPRVEVAGIYDDNYLMSRDTGEPVSVSGAEVDARLQFSGATPRSETNLVPHIRSSAFDDSELNSTGYFLDAQSEYRGQRFRAGMTAVYSSEDTSRTERPGVGDPDLGVPDGSDSGRIRVDNKRDLIAASPFFELQLTQRNKLELGANYRDVSFERNFPSQVDFSSAGASVGWGYELSPTATLTLRSHLGTYDPDSDIKRDSTFYGADGEWRKRFSDTREAYVRGGFRRTDQDALATDLVAPDVTTSYVGGVGVQWNFLVTQLFVDASVDVDPNASGVLVERDQLRFRLVRQFRSRLSGFVAARHIRDEAVGNDLSVASRRYSIGTIGAEWRRTRAVSLLAEYDYTKQKLGDVISRDAASNRARLSVVYEPQRPD